MIESPKIFRLAIHDEPRVPRLVFPDQSQIARGDLRFASCYELSAPLRHTILKVRQAVLDCQQQNGFFTCPQGTTPQSIAEFLLCSYWLGLRNEPSLESVFSECIYRLLESQNATGQGITECSDDDSFTSTLLVYFALKLSGVSVADETMVSVKKYLLEKGGFQNLRGVASGYLALFGEIPFASNNGGSESSFSLNEKYYWNALMQRNVHRQLPLSEALVELHEPRTSQTKIDKLAYVQGKMKETVSEFWIKLKSGSLYHRSPKSPLSGKFASQSYRENFYSAMASDGPTGELNHCSDLQKMFERLKHESLDAVLMADIRLQAACLESLLLSGLPVDSVAITTAAKTLCQASLQEQSHAVKTSTLRAACLVREADCSDHSLPPPIQLLSNWDTERTLAEGHSWSELLVRSIPDRVCALLASQDRKGGWEHCPFATAEAVWALSSAGLDLSHRGMASAVRFFRHAQMTDGSWKADTAANRMMVTSKVIAAAGSLGLGLNDPLIVRGASWLIANQQPGGNWSAKTVESIDTITDEGLTSLRDTALVLCALIDCGYGADASVAIGIDFLLENDLSRAEAEMPDAAPLSLAQLCPLLRALCRWIAVEDNGPQEKDPATRSLELLSISD